MAQPLVSVLTATYNGERFVAETIESVIAQTYPHVEHVLVDDGSTDNTPGILEDYAERYSDRVRVVRFDERTGPTRRRNNALDAARGIYLAWLDHDDIWDPTKLEKQVEVLEGDLAIGFVFTQWELFDDATGDLLERSHIRPGGDTLRRLFVEGCFVASSTAVWRRDVMERRGLRFRDRDFSWGDDHFLWLGLALDSRGELVDEVLTRLRRHGANESVRLAARNLYPRSIRLLDEFLAAYPEASERIGSGRRLGIARHHALAAIYELQRGRRARAAFYAVRAAARDPAGAARYVRSRLGRVR
jgi:glycosyltransferase involved in cell wall biosynthesis